MSIRMMSIAALAVVAAAAPAMAETKPYVAGFFGQDGPDQEDFNGANAGGAVRDIDAKLEDGDVFGVALGVASQEFSFGRLRGEVEISHRSSELEALALNGVGRTIGEGSDVSVTAGMINVFYDTPVYFERVRFSAGAGAGLAGINHNIRYLVANAAAIGSSPGNLQIAIPNSETTFAYQFIGGVEVALTPQLSLTGDVRYLELDDVKGERYILNSIINGVATTNGTLDSVLDADFNTTAFTVGLRFTF